jgi:hypothetical protein
MLLTVLLVVAAIVVLAAFGALALWARRSEADFSYDGPGLNAEQANAARFGIAMSINQPMSGSM